MTTYELPTVVIDGHTLTYVDTGEAWHIHSASSVVAAMHERIAETYRIAAEREAEYGREMPADLTRIAMDVMLRDIPAIGSEHGVRIRADDIHAPYIGDWTGTSLQDVVRVVEHTLGRIQDWTLNALDEHRRNA